MRTSTTSYYDSSTLSHASYNFTTKDLTVHFNHATYVYEDVSLEDFYSFEGAKSQGKALNELKSSNDTSSGSLLNELPPADYQMGN